MANLLGAGSNSFRIVFSRLLRPSIFEQKAFYSTSLRDPLPENTLGHKPVQYTSSKASKLSIAEVFGLNSPLKQEKKTSWLSICMAASMTGTIIYVYFFLDENNEFDKILNSELHENKSSELLDLKLKLIYCRNNNLPTDNLRAKIEELEKLIPPKKSPFRM